MISTQPSASAVAAEAVVVSEFAQSDPYGRGSGGGGRFSLDVNRNGTVMDEVALGASQVSLGAGYTGNAALALTAGAVALGAGYMAESRGP